MFVAWWQCIFDFWKSYSKSKMSERFDYLLSNSNFSSMFLDAPVILPESSCQLAGEVLKCVCYAEASPNASIYWTVNGNDTLLSSFNFVSTNKKNVTSGEIRGPGQSQFNISCTAKNSLGSNTKQLSVDIFPKKCMLLYTVGDDFFFPQTTSQSRSAVLLCIIFTN